jgi:hypothetical protein
MVRYQVRISISPRSRRLPGATPSIRSEWRASADFRLRSMLQNMMMCQPPRRTVLCARVSGRSILASFRPCPDQRAELKSTAVMTAFRADQ